MSLCTGLPAMTAGFDAAAACRRAALCAALGATLCFGALAQTTSAKQAPVTPELLIGALEAQGRYEPRAALAALDSLGDEIAPHA